MKILGPYARNSRLNIDLLCLCGEGFYQFSTRLRNCLADKLPEGQWQNAPVGKYHRRPNSDCIISFEYLQNAFAL
jgi:hypothetical protein